VRVRFSSKLDGIGECGLVIDTETRHLLPREAEERVRDIASRARDAGARSVFKKTDSTLRGPLAAEFRALLEVWPERSVVYAPGYPALGRTVRDGVLLVDGVPLARTAFAADPLNPSDESSVAARLSGCGAEILLMRCPEEIPAAIGPGRILVCDGETDRDLDAIAAAIAGLDCMVAGTAAMASAWAASLSGTGRSGAEPVPAVARGLVICGSLHPASKRQMEESGLPASCDTGELSRLIREHGWAALSAAEPVIGEPLTVAAHFGRVAARAVELAVPDGIAIFGGDTAFAVLRELGIDEAEPLGEILPGVAVSTICRNGAPMLLVTKAGGFGGPDYLLRIREILEAG
jgi:uncharacterized protein YgbK (DUF1537 family)